MCPHICNYHPMRPPEPHSQLLTNFFSSSRGLARESWLISSQRFPCPVEPSIVFVQEAPTGVSHGSLPRQSTPPSIPVPARISNHLAGVVNADEAYRIHELLPSLADICLRGASARWCHIMGYEVVLLAYCEKQSQDHLSSDRSAESWDSMPSASQPSMRRK
jgi:hypothetical protein